MPPTPSEGEENIALGVAPINVSITVTITCELIDGFWPNLHRYLF